MFQRSNTILRAYGSKSSVKASGEKSGRSPCPPAVNPNVAGLSEDIVKVPDHRKSITSS